mgnify:FL=1
MQSFTKVSKCDVPDFWIGLPDICLNHGRIEIEASGVFKTQFTLVPANCAFADVVYLVSSNGVSTSRTGDFPVGTKFSGSLTVNALPNNLPANSNLSTYLTSFRFTDGSGTIYSNTTQNQINFTGQTDASGKITAYALTGSVSGGVPSFNVSPGPNGISSKPLSTKM